MAEDRSRKIAVVGATGFEYASPEARVECYPWHRITAITNLADYDDVVLSLLSLGDHRRLNGASFKDVLDVPTTHQILRRPAEGTIFVLGDPRFELGDESYDATASHRAFLAWTGFDFSWDGRPGTTLELAPGVDPAVMGFLAWRMDGWRYSLKGCQPLMNEADSIWLPDELRNQGFVLTASVTPILKNRYGNPVVFSVRHVAKPVDNRVVSRQSAELVLGGPIVFLPESRLSEEDVLEFVLRDLCGVDVSAPEPKWISEFVAPGQEVVDREVDELEARIEGLIQDRKRKISERAEVRKPLKLLYETGAALEEAVRSVLEALGAEVEPPEEDRTKEDGWVTVRVGDETFEGVLEVKGVKTKHFSLEGLRQLTDWIERGRTDRRKTYTGIFVGNSSREDPPRRRIWPFNQNWVEQAELRGYAAIRTEDLYALYLLHQTDRLDRDEFWRELF